MKKVAFYTLGCKVNQYETQALINIFKDAGYEIVDFSETADIYLINTCTVTSLSDRKSRQMIRRAKKLNSDSIVVVTGCYAQTASEEVSQIEGVNLVVGTKDRSKIIQYINEIEDKKKKINAVGDIMKQKTFEELGFGIYKERARAFIKSAGRLQSVLFLLYHSICQRSHKKQKRGKCYRRGKKTCRLRLQGNSADGNTYWILWEGHKYHIIN